MPARVLRRIVEPADAALTILRHYPRRCGFSLGHVYGLASAIDPSS